MASTSRRLILNSGAEDVLLFNNDKSFFQHTGYTRTSNFATTWVDQDGTSVALGSTATFIVPKDADLLGNTDLMVTINPPELDGVDVGNSTANDNIQVAWVESLGYAMIEQMTLTIGNGGEIEVLTGDVLNIQNELFRSPEYKLTSHILKTGTTAFPTKMEESSDIEGSWALTPYSIGTNNGGVGVQERAKHSRLIFDGKKRVMNKPMQLTIPLGFFFTRRPDLFLPIGPIAPASEIRIAIKFRPVSALLTYMFKATSASPLEPAATDMSAFEPNQVSLKWLNSQILDQTLTRVRCQMTGVTAAENAALTTSEHVRLLTLWGRPIVVDKVVKMCPMVPDGNGDFEPASQYVTPTKVSIPLDFLHPVKEIVFTIRKKSEVMPDLQTTPLSPAADTPDATILGFHPIGRNYFAYHGGNTDPNVDSPGNSLLNLGTAEAALTGNTPVVKQSWCEMTSLKLFLNSQDTHPAIEGISRDYLQNRIMPSIHSSTGTTYSRVAELHAGDTSVEGLHDIKTLSANLDRKDIFVFPIALAPESSNPSGSINFSKVSTAKLEFDIWGYCNVAGASKALDETFQIDVYPLYYNWLQIKDGRAYQSFA